MNKYVFFTIILFASCSEEKHSVRFESVCNEDDVTDGYYPGKLIYFDKNDDTLKNLEAYSEAWIIIKNGEFGGVDFEKIYFPGEKTADSIGQLQIKELKSMEYFLIHGCDKIPPQELNLWEEYQNSIEND